ncbi:MULTISPECIES: DUF397 domain-containing protein [Actinomadura]|uniref:DUF397 domain-containing protein n=1 Tax=Actinomadura TaxID=1988 RepID=UPI0003F868D3|nr:MULTISPECIES: DUF397 domain-containing protein [Actinomadura]RSN71780.1 DUF397 domain-containing protein [Actinomadura sp. WAC 06369]
MTSTDLSRAVWRTSKRSQQNGACVEIANLAAHIGVRDSKAPDAGHLTLTPDAWAAFMAEARGGRFDLA